MNADFARFAIIIAVLLAWTAVPASADPASYQAVGEIPFGGQGGWDDLTIDSASHRLFVSHADRVVVIDTAKNAVLKEITGTPGVHGIALARDLQRLFTSNGKEGTVSVVDLNTLQTLTKVEVGENPDAIVYEPSTHQIYAFNGRGRSASVVDAAKGRLVATIPLPGKPEFAAVDAAAHRIYVNIEDKNSVVALDTEKRAVAATWKLESCESPSGIALDAKNHRLFSVCENQKMVMVDTTNGHTLGSVPTGEGTDGAAFDPGTATAFSSNGKSGTVSIVHEEASGKLHPVQTLKTQRGARTMTLDPADHRIYLPTASFHPSEPGARPKPVDGSQKILVFGPKA